jgi:adenylate kinase family enzyme
LGVVLGGSFILLLVSLAYHLIYFYKKGHRIKNHKSTYIKRSAFKRLVIDFPRQLILDIYNRKQFEFKEYGLHMIVGEQGSGKTTTAVELVQRLQQTNKKVKVRSNMSLDSENGKINHWKDMVKNENGIYGQIELIDEIQTWFNSNQSRNFPVEMLTEVSQQRKQRKMLIGTAQVFSRIAKPIREQVTFVYCPMTVLGCLTIVRVTKPQYWDDEKQRFKRYLKTYFFVHNDKIRNAFDTYKKIEKYSNDGFTINQQLREAN